VGFFAVSIRKGQIGIVFRIATGFNMSGSTALSITFTDPDGAQVTKTNPDVTAPAVPLVNDPDLGDVNASEYFQYTNTIDDYDQAGDWTACGIYTDGTPKVFPTAPVPFTVLEGCE